MQTPYSAVTQRAMLLAETLGLDPEKRELLIQEFCAQSLRSFKAGNRSGTAWAFAQMKNKK